MSDLGSLSAPLRVGIVGAGPAGFYAAEHLLRRTDLAVEIDMFDRLPTPFGLVRGGVAPDHEKIKSVVRAFERTAVHPNFRFFGCVELGRDVAVDELASLYSAIIVAVGAPNDRRMGIPGEELRGSLSATDFVAWYNAHPDAATLDVPLDTENVVVVGNGNVAVDVARILATPVEILARTDIADHALEHLATSAVRSVTVLGRRGPAQAAFTPKEIRELGDIPGVALLVDPADLPPDDGPGSQGEDAQRVLRALREIAGRAARAGERTIRLRFLSSPVRLEGEGRVEAVEVARNRLVSRDGRLVAEATGDTRRIPAGLVLRAVGYRGAPLAGLPFDEGEGVIPNRAGRVDDPREGLYVAGWIKRGPQGVIGTNKADAGETVDTLLEDLAAGRLTARGLAADEREHVIRQRVGDPLTWDDWCRIDAAERAAGALEGRPRRKFASVAEMRGLARGPR
jgi:ferredoxin--NADP+ reductase